MGEERAHERRLQGTDVRRAVGGQIAGAICGEDGGELDEQGGRAAAGG